MEDEEVRAHASAKIERAVRRLEGGPGGLARKGRVLTAGIVRHKVPGTPGGEAAVIAR